MADYIATKPAGTPWPIWKKMLRVALNAVEWGDHEYLRAQFGRGIWRVWITIYEPRWRFTWPRKLFPWRLRLAIEGPIRQFVWSRCTRCGSRFTWDELLCRKSSNLIFFQSGSICHKDCDAREYPDA